MDLIRKVPVFLVSYKYTFLWKSHVTNVYFSNALINTGYWKRGCPEINYVIAIKIIDFEKYEIFSITITWFLRNFEVCFCLVKKKKMRV